MEDWIGLLIAFGVMLVAYGQYRTAKQRVVLDLFERRMQVFEEVKDAVGAINREGEAYPETVNNLNRARVDATFLFDRDVRNYLDRLGADVNWMATYKDAVIQEARNRDELIARKVEVFNRITKFYQDYEALFDPYLAMRQKNPPFWRPW